jgi:hypothetical protein
VEPVTNLGKFIGINSCFSSNKAYILVYLLTSAINNLTEGRENPHTDIYKEITNGWNYDASCTLTSLPVSDLENIKRLIFVGQSVHVSEGYLQQY